MLRRHLAGDSQRTDRASIRRAASRRRAPGRNSHCVASPTLRFGAMAPSTTCAIAVVRDVAEEPEPVARGSVRRARRCRPSSSAPSAGAECPAARSSSLMLSDCSFDWCRCRSAEPLKVLPPERGMRLASGPPVSDSPRPPDDHHLHLLCVVDVEGELRDAVPENDPLTDTPFTNTRPSVLLPPCAENSAMLGISALPLTPGARQTRRRIEHAAVVARDRQRVDGFAS